MIWNHVAGFYDFFMALRNKEANQRLAQAVQAGVDESDRVLECACGTGLITKGLAEKCQALTATDFSRAMVDSARKKCGGRPNISFELADIRDLAYPDGSFDKVIAANVIHLLDEPDLALAELARVTRAGGQVIIPTYIGGSEDIREGPVFGLLGLLGIRIKNQFTYESYQAFFKDRGYEASFSLVDGKIPCALAWIRV